MLPMNSVKKSSDRTTVSETLRSRSSSWTTRFLAKPANAFMCSVDRSFICDSFNLFGLEDVIPDIGAAIRRVLSDVHADDGDCRVSGRKASAGKKTTSGRKALCGRDKQDTAAELFYGLAHARYVMTPAGVSKMFEKYTAGCFGYCPRVNCERSPVMPIGLSDVVGKDTVKVYCPRCMDVYVPAAKLKGASADGAYFGTGFPHMAFMTQPERRPAGTKGRSAAKLYGFSVHKSAVKLQRLEAAANTKSD